MNDSTGIEQALADLRKQLDDLLLVRRVDPDGALRELSRVLLLKRGSRRGTARTGAA